MTLRLSLAWLGCLAALLTLELAAAGWWPVAMLICLPHAPLLALPPALALLARKRRAFLINLGSLGLTLVLAGFRLSWPGGSGPFWRVVSYNLGAPETGGAAAATVVGLEADLVAMQEVQGWTFRDESFFPGGRDRWNLACDGEFALLSKHPIRSHRLLQVNPTYPRPIQVAEVELAGRSVTVVNMHLSLLMHGPGWIRNNFGRYAEKVGQTLAERERQVDGILAALPGDAPLLLLGDGNGQPRDPSVRRLRARLSDLFEQRGQGFGYSFESGLPVIRIDYMLASPHWRCLSCWVASSSASDHAPLVAEVVLP